MAHSFKIGDMVKCVNTWHCLGPILTVGVTYTVVKIEPTTGIDKNKIWLLGLHNYPFTPSQFELVQPKALKAPAQPLLVNGLLTVSVGDEIEYIGKATWGIVSNKRYEVVDVTTTGLGPEVKIVDDNGSKTWVPYNEYILVTGNDLLNAFNKSLAGNSSKCTCGAAACDLAFHSDWCDYED